MNNKSIEVPLRKRHNYAYGMVLGVEDFQQEYAYLQNRMKFLCRMLIGRGTVSGLQVSSDEEGESILVNAGVAVDSQGNEICLSAGIRCPLPTEGDTAYLTLSWAERDTDFIPFPGSQEDDRHTVASSVEEYAILTYEAQPTDPTHSGIILARLKKRGGKWNIDKKFRRRSAKLK
ncbi:MAG TPA: hypothetical protein VK909_02495 [Anaerolineales bacterium]|nr:hypothetical protein [Anaerolineales bacterium]